MSKALLAAVTGLLLVSVVQADVINSIYDPRDYTPTLGNVSISSGTWTINTTALTFSNGTTTYNGVLAANQSGNVKMAVFMFDGLTIGGTATITVTGNPGLVLGSRADMALGRTLSLAGANGAVSSGYATGGAGGSGAEGGTPGTFVSNSSGAMVSNPTFDSDPPTAGMGKGGDSPDNWESRPGRGYGGGLSTNQKMFSWDGNVHGAGGGYASQGGNGSGPARAAPVGGSGGRAYGDSALTNLYGGSGGSAGGYQYGQGAGGGGGGALELVALGTLSITSAINLKGGTGGYADLAGGGGGSGGGLILAATDVQLTSTASLDLRGGSAAQGGGGSGGRLAIYYDTSYSNAAAFYTSGGTGGGGRTGGAGSVYLGTFPIVVPEPATLLFLAAGGGIALTRLIRRRRPA